VLNPTSKNKYFVILRHAGEAAKMAAIYNVTKIFPSFSDNSETIKTHKKNSLRPANHLQA
jgi:hypothetical protein